MFKQADRLGTDGAVGIAVEGDYLVIHHEAKTPGSGRDSLKLSLFNAARVFGMLALFLGISLPRAVAKAIKL